MVHSLAGELLGGKIATRRPFRAPHHSASMAALVGGGSQPAARRGLAGASGRAVPRRVAGVPAQRARRPAPAAGGRRDGDRARQPSHHLPLAHSADRRHEPVQMRRQRAGPVAASAGHAAPTTTRRASRARCSIASTCRSRCPPYPLPISCCRRRPRAAPRCAPASPPRANGRARASLPSAPRACAPMPSARAGCWKKSPCRTKPASPCCARRPKRCTCPPAVSIACCAWRERLPTSTASIRSAAQHVAEALSYRGETLRQQRAA